MDFGFHDDQESYRRALGRFAQQHLVSPRPLPEVHAAMAQMGLTGMRIPEKHGGQGAGAVEAGIAAEEVGAVDVAAAYVIILTALVSDIITCHADEDQQTQWLAPIAGGQTLPALCVTEPDHGTDAANLQLRAHRESGGWRLTGEKTSITFGISADTAVVLARTGGSGPSGVSAFYVDLDAREVHRSPLQDLGANTIGRAALHFDGLWVPHDRMIGAEGSGFTSVMEGFDYSRAVIGLACLGAARASLDEALQWARDRTAFGRPIGAAQGVAFPLAECATYLRGARHLCYEALWLKDRGRPHGTEAAMAKFWAPKLATEIIHQCLLTFGHTGYSNESPLGRRLRDVIGLEIGDGTAQAAKLVISRGLLGREFAP